MKKIVRVFFNHKAFPNCCMIVLEEKETTNYIKKENVSILYNNEEIIGYNIVDETFSKYEDGYQPLNETLIQEINQILAQVDESIDPDMTVRFKVGKVIECVEHPESDHLHICKVDIGTEVLQIVCGAHNVKEDILVVVACVGAVMPTGMMIKEGKLRGYDSYGMLCSAYELGLIKEHIKGLLILDDSYVVGNEFRGE